MTLTVGSLFSGIGGIDLGLERAGMTVKWQSEIDPYACKVLKKHWPDIPNLGDIKTVDWSNVEPVDLIAGGYPCQPFSTAGKRQGENDPRHLWPYFRDAISAIRPRYALLENVRGHLTMGGTTVIGDLAQIGYDCQWQVVSAASVGAPHRRDRIIIVAYPNDSGIGTPESRIDVDGSQKSKERQHAQSESCRQCKNVAYPQSKCCNVKPDNTRDCEQSKTTTESRNSSGAQNVADTHSKQLGQYGSQVNVGLVSRIWRNNTAGQTANDFGQWWEVEPDVGRVANGIPSRVDRLRGLGNAVVPQVAEYVGRLILQSLG
jgi:DNA (cytosine-5)-methyltransferase 1